MNLWQSLKNTWNNFAFDNPEFSERIDEIRKRRKHKKKKYEHQEKVRAAASKLRDLFLQEESSQTLKFAYKADLY